MYATTIHVCVCVCVCVCIACSCNRVGGTMVPLVGMAIYSSTYEFNSQLHEDEAACHFFKSHFFSPSPSRNKSHKFYETSSLFFSKVSRHTNGVYSTNVVFCARDALSMITRLFKTSRIDRFNVAFGTY